MIFYFTGTGNSRHVARRIAARTNDRCTDMAAFLKEGGGGVALTSGERLGLVFPVYFWGLPTVVADFTRVLSVAWPQGAGTPYIYCVATYGTSLGGVYAQLRAELRRRGLRLDAAYAVRMPDCWTPMFDVSDTEKMLRKCRRAEPRIDAVAEKVLARRRGTQLGWTRLPLALSSLYHATYPSARRTSHFRVLAERCTGCGRCVRQCPTGAIEMRDTLPCWVKPECAACLRCLHHCPAFAIQYGRRTARHGQYVHPSEKDGQRP